MNDKTKPEPVARQFQGRDGMWHNFIDERHFQNTVEDGSWPIRNLYSQEAIDSLRAQLAEARRDAERWRWLKDHARIFRQSPDMSGNHYWMVHATTTLRGPTLDAAIDAAKGETS